MSVCGSCLRILRAVRARKRWPVESRSPSRIEAHCHRPFEVGRFRSRVLSMNIPIPSGQRRRKWPTPPRACGVSPFGAPTRRLPPAKRTVVTNAERAAILFDLAVAPRGRPPEADRLRACMSDFLKSHGPPAENDLTILRKCDWALQDPADITARLRTSAVNLLLHATDEQAA